LIPHPRGVFNGDEEIQELRSAHSTPPQCLHHHMDFDTRLLQEGLYCSPAITFDLHLHHDLF
jgi:hypothetical protein